MQTSLLTFTDSVGIVAFALSGLFAVKGKKNRSGRRFRRRFRHSFRRRHRARPCHRHPSHVLDCQSGVCVGDTYSVFFRSGHRPTFSRQAASNHPRVA